jgi:hypothetical protein
MICKFEDMNGNGTQDENEGGLSWNFSYTINGGQKKSYSTSAHFWDFWNKTKGCGSYVEVSKGDVIVVTEDDKAGWIHTTDKEITFTMGTENVVKKFGNRKEVISTPTPTPTATPSPTPTPTPTVTPTPSPTPGQTGGFFIRKYHDENGNGYQDSSEKGLSWKFEWDSNADNNWHGYETFETKLVEGGVVTLPVGTQVRIREKMVDGWNATTPTEVVIRIKANENQMMVFGNWRGKPTVLGTTTVTSNPLPKTGADALIGIFTSLSMAGAGLYLKRKGM